MTPHVIDLLPELALGDLSHGERAEAERHLETCAPCADELRAITETFADLTLSLEAVAPSPAVRTRMLAACQGGRFARFAEAIARIFDVSASRALELLDLVDDPAAWEPGPIAGTSLIHFAAGPACAGADTGFVRVAPGQRFPRHSHQGEETNLVLQSACLDSDGTTYRRGDIFVNAPASAHDFTAAEGPGDLVFAVRVFDGVVWHEPQPDREPGT